MKAESGKEKGPGGSERWSRESGKGKGPRDTAVPTCFPIGFRSKPHCNVWPPVEDPKLSNCNVAQLHDQHGRMKSNLVIDMVPRLSRRDSKYPKKVRKIGGKTVFFQVFPPLVLVTIHLGGVWLDCKTAGRGSMATTFPDTVPAPGWRGRVR